MQMHIQLRSSKPHEIKFEGWKKKSSYALTLKSKVAEMTPQFCIMSRLLTATWGCHVNPWQALTMAISDQGII